jgi:hypothetical protein
MNNYFSSRSLVIGFLTGSLTLLFAGSGCTKAPADLELAAGGETTYEIVVDEADEPAVRQAAAELADYLNKITGATFPIVTSSEEKKDSPRLIVGWGEGARSLVPQQEMDGLKNDGFLVEAVGSDLVLAGSTPRGTLYAVYEFLEKSLGCGWWTAAVETVPRNSDLKIAPPSLSSSSRFAYRDVYAEDLKVDPEFAVKMRRSGRADEPAIPEKWGGDIGIIGGVHTFAEFLPPEEYFDQHPEWGALSSGERVPWTQYGGQPCLSNLEFQAAFTAKVLERLDAAESPEMISVSQNDNNYRCQCDQCLAIEEEEGSASGPILRFVNAVAREVAKKYPKTLVETLAYTYSVDPPKVTKPESNVLIRLCTYLDNHAVPFSDEKNQPFQDAIQGWAAISPRLFIWDYTTDFADQWKLRPNLLNLGPNIRFFAKYPVEGVFSQGAFQQRTDFVGLRAWLVSQLLWNPAQDDQALIRRYLKGYYGAAADLLEKYIELIHKTAQNSDVLMIGGGEAQIGFGPEFFEEADKLFDEAEKAVAAEPELLRRVQIERLAPEYLRIVRYPELREEGVSLFPDSSAAEAACEQILQQAEQLGVAGTDGYLKDKIAIHKIRCLPVKPLTDVPVGGEEFFDFPAPRLYLHSFGKDVTLEPDPEAASGYAARVSSAVPAWTVQLPAVPGMQGRKWTAYARVRYEGRGSVTITFGGYDSVNKKKTGSVTQTLQGGDGYELIRLDGIPMEYLDFLYLSPASSDDTGGKLWVDRIVVVSE